ncbi:MAG: hypothetical protein PHD82_05330 [Candidatus Riflebacteria bacterium]|nr:hypothetical protein [Candidatus Riflebacteria bacterium]
MSIDLPILPDRQNPDFIGQLINFGHYLEKSARPGCKFDLSLWPNTLWQLIEKKMLSGLDLFVSTTVKESEVLMLQWYNSGIFIKTAEAVIGFDIVPLPRYYGWPDSAGLTARIAAALDALMVTHNHQDHFDSSLVEAVIRLKKPVLMHPAATESGSAILQATDGAVFKICGFSIKSHHATHVWRNSMSELPLTCFECRREDSFRIIFCGDADYTRGFPGVKPEPDALFITWRNPGPRYEDGHPNQTGTTLDAVNIVIKELRPHRLILEHYAELDHIYRGFSASYEIAESLIKSIDLPTDIFFWGEIAYLKPPCK